MMIFVYDKDGIIATNKVLNDITTTVAYYEKFIRSILLPQIWKLKKIDKGVSILHDNACWCVVQSVVNLLID